MAPRRAEAWPAHMLEDPDVRRLDPEGSFVLCRTCEAYHIVHGGRPPRPVRMTSRFRTRAWTVHKSRNMAHTRHRSWVLRVATNRDARASSEPRSEASAAVPAAAQQVSVSPLEPDVAKSCRDAMDLTSSRSMMTERIAEATGMAIGRPQSIIDTEKASVGGRIEDASRNTDVVAHTIERPDAGDNGPSRYGGHMHVPRQQTVSESEASSTGSEFKRQDNSGLMNGYRPVLNLVHAIEELTHTMARKQAPRATSQYEQSAAVEMLEEVAASLREMQHEQQQSFQHLFRLQEQTNALMLQLLAPEHED